MPFHCRLQYDSVLRRLTITNMARPLNLSWMQLWGSSRRVQGQKCTVCKDLHHCEKMEKENRIYNLVVTIGRYVMRDPVRTVTALNLQPNARCHSSLRPQCHPSKITKWEPAREGIVASFSLQWLGKSRMESLCLFKWSCDSCNECITSSRVVWPAHSLIVVVFPLQCFTIWKRHLWNFNNDLQVFGLHILLSAFFGGFTVIKTHLLFWNKETRVFLFGADEIKPQILCLVFKWARLKPD